jgi:MSHA biogenesis protein MshL
MIASPSNVSLQPQTAQHAGRQMLPFKPLKIVWPTIGLLALLTLNGCANFQRPLAVPQAAVLNSPETRTVDDSGNGTSVDIDAGFVSDDLFMLKPMVDSAPLPPLQLHGLSVTESGVYDALRLILKDTGITLNIEGGNRGSERFGPVSAFDVKGNLTEVLDTLSETIGFFYSFRKNTLFIQQEQQFVVELPPALSEDNAAGLTNTLQFLGARDAYIDRLNRSLVFRTNRPSLAKIEGYLQKIRDTRSLIIYDVNIFQVDLRDNSDTGIQWNKLGWTGTPGQAVGGGTTGTSVNPLTQGGTTTATPTSVGNSVSAGLTSLGLGLVLNSSKFSIDMLINFLQTQGNVKAISRPRLAVISGTRGTLRVGQSTTYVSKVGTNFSTSLNQVTTETRDLKTGLDLALFGDFSDNTIYTRIGLAISEIVSLNKFTALGTDLTLPTTADREINTVIRARPGDMILLGGITINRDSSELRKGITQNGTTDSVNRSELVLALKAKVVNFRGKTNLASANVPMSPAAMPAVVPLTTPQPMLPVTPKAVPLEQMVPKQSPRSAPFAPKPSTPRVNPTVTRLSALQAALEAAEIPAKTPSELVAEVVAEAVAAEPLTTLVVTTPKVAAQLDSQQLAPQDLKRLVQEAVEHAMQQYSQQYGQPTGPQVAQQEILKEANASMPVITKPTSDAGVVTVFGKTRESVLPTLPQKSNQQTEVENLETAMQPNPTVATAPKEVTTVPAGSTITAEATLAIDTPVVLRLANVIHSPVVPASIASEIPLQLSVALKLPPRDLSSQIAVMTEDSLRKVKPQD